MIDDSNFYGKPFSKDWYVQCELSHSDGRSEVVWIPEKWAVKGKYLSILSRASNQWSSGWQVTATYNKQTAAIVEACERDYRNQRRVSDI